MSTPYRLSTDVTMVPVGYGAVLLDTASGDYWELNPVGQQILDKVLAGHPESAVSYALTHEYEITVAQAEQDLSALLASLTETGLLTRSAP